MKTYFINHLIKKFSLKSPTPIKLNKLLVDFNKPIINHKKINLENNILKQGNYLYQELPIRLSHRILDLEQLPYDLLKFNSLQMVYNRYINTFECIVESKSPKNIEDIQDFSILLQELLEQHKDINLNIAQSIIAYKKELIREKKQNKNNDKINVILNRFYTSRTSIRFLIMQYLELYHSIKKNNYIINTQQNHIGIINMNCDPKNIIKKLYNDLDILCIENYGTNRPIININCLQTDIKFVYIDSYLRYVLLEILKNAIRANMENKTIDNNTIEITINNTNTDLIIKISDNGNSFNRFINKHIFDFTYTTADLDTIDINNIKSPIAGYGHGLGLSRIYCRYFGGDLRIIPFENVGTDVYIYLPKLNYCQENFSDTVY